MLSGRKRLRQLELSSEDEEDGDSMSDAGGKRDERMRKRSGVERTGERCLSQLRVLMKTCLSLIWREVKRRTQLLYRKETVVAPAHSPAPLSPPKATERDLLQVEAQPWNCTAHLS